MTQENPEGVSVERRRKPFDLIRKWIDQIELSETAIVVGTALIVGIGSGLGAVLFRRLIDGFNLAAYGGLGVIFRDIKPMHLVIIPAIGGLVFGPLIFFFAREAKGHGVPEVMEAVALRGGRIRPRVAVIKSLASAICIGTGGSVGREGPIAQIGSALGSTIGQVLRLSEERTRTLVACGAAGGISATFNAPIAGSIFALEIILGRFHSLHFGSVVIAAVVADVIAHYFEPNVRAFAIPQYSLLNPWELVLYLVLGALAALLAVGFTKLLYFSEDIWDEFRMPEYLKPVLGGAILGLIGIVSFKLEGYPRVFGVGYDTITDALFGRLSVQVTLAMLLLKALATVTTLGSGGSGGIFAPSLFMGAMVGGSFGQLANFLFPNLVAPPGAYALVGMSAFFSGAAHAPITSILILFELTGDYRIILPLMLTTVMSTLVAQALSKESIYTLKLSRRGVNLQQGQDIDIMKVVKVGEVMTRQPDTVQGEMTLKSLSEEFARTHHHGFPVLDRGGKLVGVVTIQDLKRALANGYQEEDAVMRIATTEELLVAFPDESIGDALRRMSARDVGRLPVVLREDRSELLGVLRRSDVVRAYNQALVKRAHQQHRAEALQLGRLNQSRFIHLDVPHGAPVAGKRIKEVDLPHGCLIVSVRRGRKLFVAHGYTQLQEGDRLTVFAEQEVIPQVTRSLAGE